MYASGYHCHCACFLTVLRIVYAILIVPSIVYAVVDSCRTKIPVGRSAGRGTTRDGSQAGAYQTRAQVDSHPEIVNGDQPRVVAEERVQEQVIWDTPSTMPTVALPADTVIRPLNVLEALVPNNGGLPVSQTTSQTQTQVQLNVEATQTP
ncbi:hypothetical protein HAX54_043871 [Datura stramonium]|uniref:Secreted protein n=1 Tax=Datura stramonium TaxID=4076 RepID=A0ABS8SP80_DATST|nr:hypothetical protein [Datura stramonium]